jgi:aspartate oxidase
LLRDANGERFVDELLPRDEVSRAMTRRMLDLGVDHCWLDARGVADFPTRFPGITAMLARFGLDPSRDLLPVAPALHYAMGGIQTDLEGRASIPGLWAVGEVASTGVHGANRLASNSLLEGLVFAHRAGRSVGAAAAARTTHDSRLTTVSSERDSGADDAHEATRREMRELMTANVGVQRTESSLLRAEQELDRLTRTTPPAAWRTRNQLLVARLITEAARRRRESRGGHRRLDYPPTAASEPARHPERSEGGMPQGMPPSLRSG